MKKIGGRGAPVRCGKCYQVHSNIGPCPEPKSIDEARKELEGEMLELKKFHDSRRPIHDERLIC